MGYLLAITHTLTYAEKDVNCAKLVQWSFWERGVRIVSTRLGRTFKAMEGKRSLRTVDVRKRRSRMSASST